MIPNIKNRLETGVETFKQSVVNNPAFGLEIVCILGIATSIDQYLSGDPDALSYFVLAFVMLVTAVWIHYKIEIERRDP